MSTKSTLGSSTCEGSVDCPSYHFYEECFERDGSVYLSIDSPVEFEANQHGVTIKIPAAIWNRIIKVGERFPTDD
jgi:hypothetical protein